MNSGGISVFWRSLSYFPNQSPPGLFQTENIVTCLEEVSRVQPASIRKDQIISEQPGLAWEGAARTIQGESVRLPEANQWSHYLFAPILDTKPLDQIL